MTTTDKADTNPETEARNIAKLALQNAQEALETARKMLAKALPAVAEFDATQAGDAPTFCVSVAEARSRTSDAIRHIDNLLKYGVDPDLGMREKALAHGAAQMTDRRRFGG